MFRKRALRSKFPTICPLPSFKIGVLHALQCLRTVAAQHEHGIENALPALCFFCTLIISTCQITAIRFFFWQLLGFQSKQLLVCSTTSSRVSATQLLQPTLHQDTLQHCAHCAQVPDKGRMNLSCMHCAIFELYSLVMSASSGEPG